jgi:hypothetical protein
MSRRASWLSISDVSNAIFAVLAYLELRVNRRSVRIIAGEEFVQFDSLHLEVGSAADFRLLEVQIPPTNFSGLLDSDAEPLADDWIV